MVLYNIPRTPDIPDVGKTLSGNREAGTPRWKVCHFLLYPERLSYICLHFNRQQERMRTGRIERETKVVRKMIELYCRHKLHLKEMPDEYVQLCDYASKRLSHCRYGDAKGACQRCRTHCYAPAQREMIRKVMRWVGPRMLLYAPLTTIRHWMNR